MEALSGALRDLGDIGTTRNLIFENVSQAAQKLPPVANQRYRLELNGVGYTGPERYSKEDEKQAIIGGKSLTRRLQGTWHLVDNVSGHTVEAKQMTLAHVPYMTHRGTYINNGNEYVLQNQLRLYPGIFTRQKETGEIEAHANVAKGFGHRYHLDPQTGQFKLEVGQASLPLYPILQALGVSDSHLREQWGEKLFHANTKRPDPQALKKLYAKVYHRPYAEQDGSLPELIRKAIEGVEIDPDIAKQTLGQPFQRLSADTILATTQKLLKVHKGEAEPDDRDALQYQKVYTPEDLFAHRIRLAGGQLRSLLWKLTTDGSLRRMRPAVFQKAIRGTLLDTGLGNALEEVNPIEILDARSRITKLGEGGIPSLDAAPDESRSVQPSQLGYLDPVVTPESARAGLDSRLSIDTKKDDQHRIYTRYRDPQGQVHWLSPQQLVGKTIAFAGEMQTGEPYVRALVGGRIRYVPRDKINFEQYSGSDAFGPAASLIPFKANDQGQRVSMASRMITQALPLVNGEAPLVRAALADQPDRSFEEHFGRHAGAVHSDAGGTVVAVSPKEIRVKGSDGKIQTHELDYYRVHNRKTFLHNTPVVQVGQTVQPGGVLAKSNFTDDKGAVALGLNARTAYIPNGWNTDDAIVISESMAKRGTSEHAYQHTLDKADGVTGGKSHFTSVFPATYNRHILQQFDDDGVIQPGSIIKHGEPLILATKQVTAGPRLGRRKHSYADATVTWDHEAPGMVTDVHKGPGGINVIVRSTSTMEVGDKMSGRHGDKGIIAQILPDSKMPVGEDGKPYEVLVNPQGLITRGNPGQNLEGWLGKIAAATGQPYKLVDFQHPAIPDMRAWVEQELQKHGLKSTEALTDPATGRKIPGVQTGNRWFMKLHHSVEGKLQGRGIGNYSAEGLPQKGGKEGAKTFGMLNLNAVLSHGAYDVIRDIGLHRGQQLESQWRQFMGGFNPPNPTIPHMYEKFFSQLQAAGINPVRTGSKTRFMAMTPQVVDQLTEGRELENPETVDWRLDNLSPIKGGLFDETLTGGHGGKRWAAIKLHEPMPNPVMEEPIRRLLGLTEKQFREDLAKDPKAVLQQLKNIDVDKEIERCEQQVKGTRKTARDIAIRKLHFLQGCKNTGTHPQDWFLSKVPVLPPLFRPVSMIKDIHQPLVADINHLYKTLMEANNNLKDLSSKTSDTSEERLGLYDAFKAVSGIDDPVLPEQKQQHIKGLLKTILGSSPKRGIFQRKLLGGTVDLVGRTTISPNPDLDMDEVLIPEDAAWSIYKPFIVRRLVRQGIGRVHAMMLVDKKAPEAHRAMVQEMGERPVIVDRAPILHRYGVMALKPRLTKAKTLQYNPLLDKGFGSDYDGDAQQFQVPFSPQAVREAYEKMLPSKNLFSASTFKVHQVPSQEYISGLHAASTSKNERHPKVFQTKADAIRAYERGEIDLGQALHIVEA